MPEAGSAYSTPPGRAEYGNPAFKFKRLDNTNPQQGFIEPKKDTAPNDYTDRFNPGDRVTGQRMGGDDQHTGDIVQIERDRNGDGMAVIIVDEETQRRIRLDPSSVTKSPKKGQEVGEPEGGEGSGGMTPDGWSATASHVTESQRLLGYRDFRNSRQV